MTHATVSLDRGTLELDKILHTDVKLWHLAPIWPGREKARINAGELERLIKGVYELTRPQGLMVLWMPAAELHRTPFDPLDMVGNWTAMSTIISGSKPIRIGYVYSKEHNRTADWGCKLILDTEGRQGPSSSLTMKWLLDTLVDGKDGCVVDPYAHRSVTLAQWCRRLNIPYHGFIRGKNGFEAAQKRLAQVELPGIQQQLL